MTNDVIFYITKFDDEIQERLFAIRFTALNDFQGVDEKLYHNAPSFVLDGKEVMNYVAYKKHISIILTYPWQGYLKTHSRKLREFLQQNYPLHGYTEHTIQFPHKEPFPYELVDLICKLIWQDVMELKNKGVF